METTWHYLVDQFVNATEGNYKKALRLTNYHDAYLKKMMDEHPLEPDWTTLYNRYHPFHDEYVRKFSAWETAGGSQKGQTLNLDQYLLLLVNKINRWDSLVQSVSTFEKGTPNYLAIFPRGYKPYNSGAKTARVNAVNTLAGNMQPFAVVNPAILAIQGEVQTFYTTIDGVRDTQEGAKGGTKQNSEEVELSRIEVMTEEYRDLGFLINKGAEEPLRIAPFFELLVLRDHQQVKFTGTLDAGENEAVLIHTFLGDDEIELEITGDAVPPGTQVQFYLATTPNGTDSTVVNVTANAAKITIQASAFGAIDFGTHRYLTAVNSSGVELHYVVELF